MSTILPGTTLGAILLGMTVVVRCIMGACSSTTHGEAVKISTDPEKSRQKNPRAADATANQTKSARRPPTAAAQPGAAPRSGSRAAATNTATAAASTCGEHNASISLAEITTILQECEDKLTSAHATEKADQAAAQSEKRRNGGELGRRLTAPTTPVTPMEKDPMNTAGLKVSRYQKIYNSS